MSDSFFDKFIADLVKGAEVNSRANGGPGVNIIVDRENRGREEKLANHAGIGGALMGPLGAAIGADKGHGLQAAGGSLLGMTGGGMLGGLGGAGLGGLIGALAGNPGLGASLGGGLGMTAGSIGGSAYGGHKGGEGSMLERARDKLSALEEGYAAGVKAACATFGIKEAFLGPLIGAVAGPALARAGLGAAAKGALGAGAAGIAGKVAPRIASGIGGGAFDMAASTAGQAVGQKMTQPPPPPTM